MRWFEIDFNDQLKILNYSHDEEISERERVKTKKKGKQRNKTISYVLTMNICFINRVQEKKKILIQHF